MTIYQSLLDKLHRGKSPYTGFPEREWDGAWYGDPGAQRNIFRQAIDKAKPGLIIEVGSFVGESAIFMAEYLQAIGRDSAILCVDTFYGGVDHYKGAPEKINMHFGRPDLYYRFVSNVIQRGQQDRIVPLALDSVNAARLLKTMGIVPQMVYVDASHEAGDVLQDLIAYWHMLEPGGVMLVDDLSAHFPAVVKDWDAFLSLYHLKPFAMEGEKGMLVK
jgi:cephalosporin hydroxylase